MKLPILRLFCGLCLSLVATAGNDGLSGLRAPFEPAGTAGEFVSRAPGRTLALNARGGFELRVEGRDAIRMRLEGAGATPVVEALEPGEGRSHYFTGGSRESWRLDVPHFGRVRYVGVWAGVDLDYYGVPGAVEYDLRVRPGADADVVGLVFEGQDSLRLDEAGNLVLLGSDGLELMRMKRPLAYQPGDAGRAEVAAGFALLGRNRVGFELGEYDRSRLLVIDPLVVTTSTYGGSATDAPFDVVADSEGNIFLTGTTNSANFPTVNALQPGATGLFDAFVMKLDPTGQDVLFATYLGSPADDQAFDIALDANGNPVVCGVTASASFPTTFNALQGAFGGGVSDGFVTKLSSDGSQLLYSSFVGGNGADEARGVDFDAAGNLYLAGATASTDFATTSGAAQRTNAGGRDAFVRKLNPAGTNLLYSTLYGGSVEDFANGLDVTGAGVAFIAGTTLSLDLPTSQGALQTTTGGGRDAFLAAFSADGTARLYAGYLGGSQEDNAFSVAVDEVGTVWVAGLTASGNFPTGGEPAGVSPGSGDGFLAAFRFDATGGPPALGLSSFVSRLCCGAGYQSFAKVGLLSPGGVTERAFAVGLTDASLGAVGEDFGACPTNGFLIAAFDTAGTLEQLGCSGSGGGSGLHVLENGSIIATGERGGNLVVKHIEGPLPPGLGRPTSVSSNNGGVVGDPVGTKTGELFETVTEFSLGGMPGLNFERFYSSVLEENGVRSALGRNWMHSFDIRVVLADQRATVVLFGGRRISFVRVNARWATAAPQQREYQLADILTGFQFADPAEGLVYTFSQTGLLTVIRDRNGNEIAVTHGPEGPILVTDRRGRSLLLEYNGDRLTRVSDHTGRSVDFTLENRDLVAVKDVSGGVTNYSYAEGGLLLGARRPKGNQPFQQVFDAQRRVVEQSDSVGNATTLAFDQPEAGVTRILDPRGSQSRHRHGEGLALTELIDAVGNMTAVAYDANGRRTSVTDRDGLVTSLSYDNAGNVVALVDPAGRSTSFTWIRQQQGEFFFPMLADVDFPDGNRIALGYDARGNLLSSTDQEGNSETFLYDERGRLTTATNRGGGVTTYTYNNDNTLASLAPPGGGSTTFGYDAQKRLSQARYADGATYAYAYNAGDRLTSVTDGRGGRFLFAYDGNGSPRLAEDPRANQSALTHDSNDRLAAVVNRLGERTQFRYDAAGNLERITNALGEIRSIGYNNLDRAQTVSDGEGKVSVFTYSNEGLPATVADPLNRVWRFVRDPAGRITRVTAPSGASLDRTFDPAGRLRTLTDTLGGPTNFNYDRRGLLTSVEAPGELRVRLQRNALGAVTRLEDPKGNSWRRVRDNQGRLVESIDPANQSVEYVYDSRGRLSGFRFDNGSGDLSYDANGNLMRASYSDGVQINYSYDEMNRLVSSDGLQLVYDAEGRIINSNGVAMARDEAGRITVLAFAPGNTVNFEYNRRGLLTRVMDWIGGAVDMSYDDAGQLVEVRRPNAVTTRYSYDRDGRVVEIREESSLSGVMTSIRLTRDAAGKVVSAQKSLPVVLNAPLGVREFAYDPAHRLAGVSYDKLGRLVGVQGTERLVWDLGSRLISYVRGESVAANGYDGLGMRVSRIKDGRSEEYRWNYALELPSISVLRVGGVNRRYFVHAPDGSLIYSIEVLNNERRYYHFDWIGNTTMLTDDAGDVIAAYDVSPYGEVVSRSGNVENPFTFLGRWGVMQEGDTGHYYMRRRYYDSRTARFLSRDRVSVAHPRAVNPYSYALGNPVSFLDPTGSAATRESRVEAGIDAEAEALSYVESAQGSGDDLLRTPKLTLRNGSTAGAWTLLSSSLIPEVNPSGGAFSVSLSEPLSPARFLGRGLTPEGESVAKLLLPKLSPGGQTGGKPLGGPLSQSFLRQTGVSLAFGFQPAAALAEVGGIDQRGLVEAAKQNALRGIAPGNLRILTIPGY